MTDHWTILIPAPTKWMNANQRHNHWSERSGPTKLWRDAAAVVARAAKVPALERAAITATVHRPDRRRDADAHNRYPTVKAVVDGLVDAGVLPDDCDRYLAALTIQPGDPVDKKRWPLGALGIAICRIEEGSLMPWFMSDDKLHSHKKTVRATAKSVAPMGLWVLAGSWSSDQLTDGFIPEYIAMRLDPHGWEENAAALVKAGLWVVDEFDDEQGWRFHQWDQRNPTRVKVEAKREAARERMERVRSSRKGGSQDVRANTSRTDSEPAEHFAGTSRDVRLTPTQPSPTHPSTSLSEAPPRDDVERLCEHLADWVEKNGSKRPTITKKWRDAARLMLDRDGRTEEQVRNAIGWCQQDDFWKPNIMSMPKLREKYDQLRLAAQRQPSNVVAIRGNDFDAKHAMLAEQRRRAAALDALDERAAFGELEGSA